MNIQTLKMQMTFSKRKEKKVIQKEERREIIIGARREYGGMCSDLSYFSPRKRKYRRKNTKTVKA